MLDIILVVDDLKQFHQQNLQRNARDYARVWRMLGVDSVTSCQRRLGNRVWFHPFVEGALPGGQQLKYGIVELKDFEKDLTDWTDLYIAGRLHKPVKKHFPTSVHRNRVDALLSENRQNALNAALLLLSEEVSEHELYTKVAQLSYEGDIRGSTFEDPRKVLNIVDGQLNDFKMIYRPLLEDYATARLELDFCNERLFQDLSAVTILTKLNACPINLQVQIAKVTGKDDRQQRDTEEILRTVARHPLPMDCVIKGLRQIVSSKTRAQVMLTFLSAGFWRSIIYAWKKLQKGFNSK